MPVFLLLDVESFEEFLSDDVLDTDETSIRSVRVVDHALSDTGRRRTGAEVV